jgi:enoyl-[acyl-carrier protein] reductase I
MLAGKRILVTGALTRDSIAFHAAELAQRSGAEVVLTSFGRARRLTERAAKGLPRAVDVLELDAQRAEDYEALAEDLQVKWGGVDGALHAIAFAPTDALGDKFLSAPVKSAQTAFHVSAVSLRDLGRTLAPLMPDGGSIVGLDFDAQVAWPVYDWMGVAKAALEATSRYLARDLGPLGIRVNLVSAGPLETVAARGIPGFAGLAERWSEQAPLGWDTEDPEPVAGAIAFLLSDFSRAITGQVLKVDGGYSAVGAPAVAEAAAATGAGEAAGATA